MGSSCSPEAHFYKASLLPALTLCRARDTLALAANRCGSRMPVSFPNRIRRHPEESHVGLAADSALPLRRSAP